MMRIGTCMLLLGAAAVAAVGCKSPEMARKDMLREGRIGCERGDASACFHAGLLYAEGGNADHAATLHAKGCALKHAGSCDALASVKGADREAVLAAACSAGDLLTCTRLADDYAKTPATAARSKA